MALAYAFAWFSVSKTWLANQQHKISFWKKSVAILLASLMLCSAPAPVRAGINTGDIEMAINVALYWGAMRSRLEYLDGPGKGQILAQAQRQFGFSKMQEAHDMLRRIAPRVVNATGEPGGYSLWVNPNRRFNAACMLGKNITINQGVFELSSWNEDMVAVVVAHEVAHAKNKHIMRNFDSMVSLQALRDWYVMSKGGALGDTVLADMMANQIAYRGFSQGYEWEADNKGFEYLVKAGYNPGAAVAVWTLVSQKYGNYARSWSGEIFNPSTHPSHDQRISNYKKKVLSMSDGRLKEENGTLTWDGQALTTENWPNIQPSVAVWLEAGARILKK